MNENSETPQESEFPPLGQQLLAARERANLSQEHVAKRLNLTVQRLDDLEQDRLDKVGAPIFIKGYVKAYCKQVGLDYEQVIKAFPQDMQAPVQTNMQSFSKRTKKEAHDRSLMFISYLILAIILGSSLYWWWQTSDTKLNDLLSPASSEQSSDAPQQNTPVEPQATYTEQEVPSNTFEQHTNEPALNTEPENELAQSAQQQSVQGVESNDAPTSALEQNAPAHSDNTAPSNEQIQSELGKGEIQVTMQFHGECWVEVQDGEGTRLAYDIKNTGQSLSLIGKAPFTVTLGKHTAVDVQLNGEAVDMSEFPENRLAKFTLPLTE